MRRSGGEVAAAEVLGALFELGGSVGADHGHISVVALQTGAGSGGAGAGGAEHDVYGVGGGAGYVLLQQLELSVALIGKGLAGGDFGFGELHVVAPDALEGGLGHADQSPGLPELALVLGQLTPRGKRRIRNLFRP